MSRKIAIILLVIIVLGLIAAILVYTYETKVKTGTMLGNHTVLILAADPSETRPGPGAVDMAFVVVVKNGTIANMTPIYPGALTHPNESAPTDIASMSGDDKLYLHDTLWWSDVNKDVKLAQETVEYNTNITTDSVVIVKPEAVDALINAIGPVYVPNQGYVNMTAIDFLREEQNNGNMTRGDAVESLAAAIKNASYSKAKRSKAFTAITDQYSKGNIIVIPPSLFYELLGDESLNWIF